MSEKPVQAGGRVADVAAVAGIVVAVAAALAASLLLVIDPNFVPPLWWSAFLLGLSAALISWLALAMGTHHRHFTVAALVLGSLIAVGMAIPFLGFLLGGGD